MLALTTKGLVIMDLERDIEAKLLKQQQESKALELRIEALNREVTDLMQELEVHPEKLRTFVEDSSNFTSDNWSELQRLTAEMDQKLQCELNNIPNPKNTQKKQAERQVQSHWLFVR